VIVWSSFSDLPSLICPAQVMAKAKKNSIALMKYLKIIRWHQADASM
jgi:hypothetical protein